MKTSKFLLYYKVYYKTIASIHSYQYHYKGAEMVPQRENEAQDKVQT